MALSDLTSRDAVTTALDEFDAIGRDAFLTKYGFGRARRYFVRRDGKYYDSKAIAGAAVGFEHPNQGPMPATAFNGGEHGARKRLADLGFDLVARPGLAAADTLPLRDALETALVAQQRRDPHQWSDDLQKAIAVTLPNAIRTVVGDDFRVKGSAGFGNQAEIPWVSVMPPGVKGASEGRYVVYLFSADGSRVFLSLSQAVTGQPKVGLAELAELLRTAAGSHTDLLDEIDLGGTGELGERYALATAYALRYEAGSLPTAERLESDLSRFLMMLDGVLEDGGAAEVGASVYNEPSFFAIVEAIEDAGLTIDPQTLRRYHVSIKTRGFVVLSGISGTGKTWLAQAYADAIGARHLVVPVAPNWTTNEDLLGYLNPLDGEYHDTEFSVFLRSAAKEFDDSVSVSTEPVPYHLILDEMNLARVEYYFAKFLSAMEQRARPGGAKVELAPGHDVRLPPNLKFIGTVNIDETTHGFADKVYDRSQLIELTIDETEVLSHLQGEPYAAVVADIWAILSDTAPFAFRVLDEIKAYVEEAATLGVSWEVALDEQLLQKVLPKIKGTDLRLGPALKSFTELAVDRFPLSHKKASSMLKSFTDDGFTSYF